MAYALWERQTLESFFADNWVETPIKWENHPFLVPRNGGLGSASSYVCFLLHSGTGVVVSLGSSLLMRNASLILIQVYVPEMTDKLTSLTYTDQLIDLWVPQDFTDGENVIRTRPAYHRPIGAIDGWYQTNVFVPYILDVPVPNH